LDHRSAAFASTQTCRHSSHGDTIDIHNALITDIDEHVLKGDLSDKLGKLYLSTDEPIQEQVPKINGLLYGTYDQPIFTIPTIHRNVLYHVHYLFNTSSPTNYMSIEVSESLRTQYSECMD